MTTAVESLREAIRIHTGCDPLSGGFAGIFAMLTNSRCQACGTVTATALLVDDEDGYTERRVCENCAQW